MKTKRPLAKPAPKKTPQNLEAVKAFAEATTAPVKGHEKAKVNEGIADTEKQASKDTDEAKFRLTMNISKSVHRKLKIAAAKQGTNMTVLLEKLVNEHLDD